MTPKYFFYKSAQLVGFLPLEFFIRITGQKLIYPFYHLVADDDVLHIKHLYKPKTSKEFEADLDYLCKKYEPVSISELLHGGKSGRGFVLTFDDGLREFHDVVAPILLRKGIPATCFLNTGFIDNKDLFFRYKASVLVERIRQKPLSNGCRKKMAEIIMHHKMAFDEKGRFLLGIQYMHRNLIDEIAKVLEVNFVNYNYEHQPYLTDLQIKSLISKGFVFGAHGIDHPMYSEISGEEQIRQTVTSINEVDKRYNSGFRLFSFPFTDHNLSTAFFDHLFTNYPVDLTFGCAGIKKDEFKRNIQRIPMETGAFNSREIIRGEYLYYVIKAIVNKNTIKRS